MRRLILMMAAALGVLVLTSGAASATSINIHLDIPTYPYPPLISDVTNTYMIAGSQNFTVSATLVGQRQVRPACDEPTQTNCTSDKWHFVDQPGVFPNPPVITSAKVYYYKNDQNQFATSVDMVATPELGDFKWKANVPPAGTVEYDTITYYIVAVDSLGNVASQVPDTGNVNQTCPSSPSGWDPDFSTPPTNNCAQMTSVSTCDIRRAVPPAVDCPTTYTMNDPNNDVCGPPDGNGNQSVISLPKQDIKGLTAAAYGTNFCANMGLGASPPDPTDAPPIETYALLITNPDIYDENPADLWMKNAYALTFAPEIVGTDPSLVRVLWDENCMTDPNTPNILDCKLITITGSDPRLQINYSNGLKFIVKKSGTGDTHPVPYSLIGSTSKSMYMMAYTAELNLSGGSAFWFADKTPAMNFIQKNQMGTVGPSPQYCVAILGGNSTKCSVDGTGGTSNMCPKSATMPAQNKCKITFLACFDTGFVTEYRIYRNSIDSYSSTTLAGAVPGAGPFSFTDTFLSADNELDGSRKYYFLTSYNANATDPNKRETPLSDAVRTNCTVEDWVPPAQPAIVEAKTPAGNEAKCKLKFSMPGPDPSLKSFFMSRDGAPVNFSNQMGANNATSTFEWTDPTLLELGHTPYDYTVTATDLGDNTNTSASANCTTEDLKAPAQINTVMASNAAGTLGVHLDWQASTESDLSGYNAYYCPQINANSCKVFDGQFTKLNSSLLTSTTIENNSAFTEGDYCFYAEACDKCSTNGTCPSNGGSDNCSGFPAGGAASTIYVKCLTIDSNSPPLYPAFPLNVTVTAPPEGKKCKLAWEKNYVQSGGQPFSNIIYPIPTDLIGYKIMRGNTGAEPPTPSQAAPVGIVALGLPLEFTDTTVLNGSLQTPATYKYAMYSVDGSNNFSENGAGGNISIVTCHPMDTVAPATPTMSVAGYGPADCSPSWQPVSDAASYNLFKCTGDAWICNSASKFALVSPSETCVRQATGTTCTDNDVTADTTYRYCVTAVDDSGNESGKYPVWPQANCAVCTPSARPRSITAVTAAATSDNMGVKLFWTNSLDDAHSANGGVNIYRCTSIDCSTKTKTKSCSDLKSNSAQVMNISALSPLSIPTGEPAGTWFYGATFQSDCSDSLTESFLTGTAISEEPVTIPNIGDPICMGDPSKCIIVSSCSDPVAQTGCDGGLSAVDTSAGYPAGGTRFPTAPKSGIKVSVLSASGNEVGSGFTDAYGNYKIQIDNSSNALNLADKYQGVFKISGADKTGVPCSNDLLPPSFVGMDCAVIAKSDVILAQGAANTNKISLPKIPAAFQGRSEIGNPNCDDTIDGSDFLILRNSYGKDVGPGANDAKSYADFNGDGTVDGDDFLILRQNYGKNLIAPPMLVPGLCDH